MKRTVFILGIIFILGLFLRFYQLGDVPVGFHRDEAFLGYNAYSILKTGRDMSGNFLPLHLESFLYSPAGYSYFSIPFIKIFDLNAFSVRFASAFFGSLTILVTYFLTKELFRRSPLAIGYSLIAAILLTISPWHINLSRTANENVLVVFFISLGVLLFLIWREKQKWYLLLFSFLSFGATLFIYQASRAFLPIFIPFMVFILPKVKFDRKKLTSILILFILVILIPLSIIFLSKELTLRLRTVSIFATAESQLIIDEQLREDGVSNVQRFLTRTFHNKPLGYSFQVLQNYFKHFSYDFLFTDKGLPDRYRIPLTGLLLIFELPLLTFGIWSLLRMRNSAGAFLIGWLLLAPFGSALTFDDVPNLQRTLLVFPALSIIEGVGLIALSNIKHQISNIQIKYPIYLFAFLFFIFNFSYYLHQYYVHGPRYRPWYRHDGYKELIAKTKEYLVNYDKIVITDHESAPAIFFLFFGKYNPHLFQEETRGSAIQDFDRIGFGKYDFSQEECPLRELKDQTGKEKGTTRKENVLYVNYSACAVPQNSQKLEEIKRSDGTAVFKILESKKSYEEKF